MCICDERSIGLGGTRHRGDEHPVGLLACEVEPCPGLTCVHEDGSRLAHRLGVHERAVRLVVLAFEVHRAIGGPQVLHEGDEFIADGIAHLAGWRRLDAELSEVLWILSSHNIQAPASTGDRINGCADLRDVKGVELVPDVAGGEDAELAGDRRRGCSSTREVIARVIPFAWAPVARPHAVLHLAVHPDALRFA